MVTENKVRLLKLLHLQAKILGHCIERLAIIIKKEDNVQFNFETFQTFIKKLQ